MKIFKIWLHSLIALLIVISAVIPSPNALLAQKDTTSLITVLDSREMELSPGAHYTWLNLELERGLEKVHALEIDLKGSPLELQPGMTNGKVYGMTGVSKMAGNADQAGNRVIAAVNADFYDMSTGIPLGLFIGDGIILNTPSGTRNAFGVKADGTAVFGQPKMKNTLLVNGQSVPISAMNRTRGDNDLILYSPDFYTSTKSNTLGDEIVLDVTDGEVRSGGTLKMKVVEVRRGQGDTPLMEGQVVLSASGTAKSHLQTVDVGDELEAQFSLEGEWHDVQMAVGASQWLVKDGQVAVHSDTSVHPRTAVGVKEDGKLVLLTVDGRAPGFSEGMTLEELGHLLQGMGVTDALNLDGGGSTTFIARLPGDSNRTLLNRPSDGGERSTANGILVVNKAPEGAAQKLVIEPGFERVLAGSSIPLQVAAVDANGHPAQVQDEITWSVQPELAAIEANGTFIAGDTAGVTEVKAAAGGLTGTAQIEVVDTLTELKFPDVIRSVETGSTVQFSVTALRNGQVIQANHEQLEWRVEGPIGTIEKDGTFKATDQTQQEGKVIVSYKGVETEVTVKVGLPPVVIEDFEQDLNRYHESSGARYVKSSVSITTDEEYVRFGNQAMKLEYDFTGQVGTSGAYLTANGTSNRLELPGYPEKLSMWVYGDGKGYWLRAQLRDGNNAAVPVDFTSQTEGVNWVGWKYVEGTIPQGRPLPLTVEMPVRYMAVSNDNKGAGAIYVDQIRALYGPVDEDIVPPLISGMEPLDGSTVNDSTPAILAYAVDDLFDPNHHGGTTLIDPDSIRMYINGEPVDSYALYPPEGRISYTPNEPLPEGVNTVLLQVKDSSGNRAEQQWSFFVDSGGPKWAYQTEERIFAGHTHTLDIQAVKPSLIQSGHIAFDFDVEKVDVLQVAAGEKLDNSHLQAEVDEIEGTVRLSFDGLNTLSLTEEDVLAEVQYRVKSDAEGQNVIGFVSSDMYIAGKGQSRFVGYPVSSVIDYHLQLEWDEEGVAQGFTTTLAVTDRSGTPVPGAEVKIVGGSVIGVTDSLGILKTDLLTKELTEHRIQAVKQDQFSPVLTFKVSELAGTPEPYNISVTMGQDPSVSRMFTWHTDPNTLGTVVEYAKQQDFTGFDAANVHTSKGESSLFNTLDIGTVRVHKAEVHGLEPGTTYVYRVGDGSGHYSGQGSFTTAKGTDDPFKFIFIGDSQAGNEAGFQLWGDTIKKAVSDHPDAAFVVHAGDIVDSGYKETEWNMWFAAAQEQLLHTTLVAAVGNHEVMGTKQNGDFLAHFHQPQNGIDSLKGTHFSFDYQDVHFVVLNSEYDYEEQAEWLKQDLAATNKSWTIVLFHRGPYGSQYDTEVVRELWVPVLDQYGVDLVLNGHDHIYLRTYPMKGNSPTTPEEGTTYVVGGSSGPKFYGLTERPWQQVTFAEETQIYSAIEIVDEQLKFTAKTVKDDRIVDEFVLNQREKAELSHIELSGLNEEMSVGSVAQSVVEAVYTDGTRHAVTEGITFSSSDESVVAVNSSGTVQAIGSGTAFITAEYKGLYAAYEISVVAVGPGGPDIQLETIMLNGLHAEMHIGNTASSIVEAVYSDGSRYVLTEGVVFRSSDESIAAIDSAGTVHALNVGTAVIYAHYAGIQAEYVISVVDDVGGPNILLEQIEISGLHKEMRIGDTAQTVVEAVYADGSRMRLTEGVTFISTNERVALVDEAGQVRAVGSGSTVIQAVYASFSDSISINVRAGQVYIPWYPAEEYRPEPAPEPGYWTITEDEIRQLLQGDSAVLTMDEDFRELKLPVSASDVLGSASLVVQAPNMRLTVPTELLGQLRDLASNIGEESFMTLSAQPLSKHDASLQLARMEESTGAAVTARSPIYEFQWTLTDDDGEIYSLTEFRQPLVIELAVQKGMESRLAGIYHLDEDGSFEFIGGEESELGFTASLHHFSKYAVLEYHKSFSDVKEGFWAEQAIRELAAKHLIQGASGHAFAPERPVTRAEFAALLVRLLNIDSDTEAAFADVPEDAWYAAEVAAAAEAGIVNGIGDDLFAPNGEISREEMTLMIVRAYEYKISRSSSEAEYVSPFIDLNSAAEWARSAIEKAYGLGLVSGVSKDRFVPKGRATRAESVQLIHNLYELMRGKH